MDADAIIEVEGLSKRFCRNLRRSLWYGLRDIFDMLRFRSDEASALRRDEFWALDNVSFRLGRGEGLGVLGRNGAGKTTLLRLLMGRLRPTRGRIMIHGTALGLTGLGMGFNPVLSGRENAYINAAVLGLSRKQVDEILDAIIDYAELREFIDTPVKTYSSGMRARLGFSVATHLQPEVLLMDQVLRVGDMMFRHKCVRRIKGYLAEGGSLILVCHEPHLMQSVCDRCLVIDRGRLLFDGPAVEAGDFYVKLCHDEEQDAAAGRAQPQARGRAELAAPKPGGPPPPTPETAEPRGPPSGAAAEETPVVIRAVDIVPADGEALQTGKPARVVVHYEALRALDAGWSFLLLTADLAVTIASCHRGLSADALVLTPGEGTLSGVIPALPLQPGAYALRAIIGDPQTAQPIAAFGWQEAPAFFTVESPATSLSNLHATLGDLVQIEVQWEDSHPPAGPPAERASIPATAAEQGPCATEVTPSSNPFGVGDMPQTSYIVCTTQRSGSNLLCSALWATDLAGRPDEYFMHWYFTAHEPACMEDDRAKQWLVPPDAYLRKLVQEGTTANGILGVKLMWGHFGTVIENLRTLPQYRDLPAPQILGSVFPNLHYIHVVRNDKARQAVSMVKALQSKHWVEFEEWAAADQPGEPTKPANTNLVYDFNEILYYYTMFQEDDAAWEAHFREAGTEPYRVVYEQLVNAYGETALEVLRYLGISQRPHPRVLQRPALKRQSDAVNEEWAERFQEDLARMRSRAGRDDGRPSGLEEGPPGNNAAPSPNLFYVERMPQTSYIICGTQRSGSNLLCEALWATGLAGGPREPFLVWYLAAREPERLKDDFVKPWLIPRDAYLRKLISEGTSANGVFGVKIMWSYFGIVIDNLRTFPEYEGLAPSEILRSVFPDLHYIHMTRRDKVRQAVSMARATQSRKWVDVEPWVLQDETDPFLANMMPRLKHHLANFREDEVQYDFDQIERFHAMLVDHDRAWEAYFAESGIRPYRVVYEDLADSYEETAIDVLRHLEVPLPDQLVFKERFLRRQGDSVNDEWAQRFREDSERKRVAALQELDPEASKIEVREECASPSEPAPAKSYLVCASPRGGSSLLVSGLRDCGVAGAPREYFAPSCLPRHLWEEVDGGKTVKHYTEDYVRSVVREYRTGNGVFGVKVMWQHFEQLMADLRRFLGDEAGSRSDGEVLKAFFSDRCNFIFVTRKDKLKQAISWEKAEQTGVWLHLAGGEAKKESAAPVFDYDQIRLRMALLREREEHWQDFFGRNGITPLTIVYKDFEEHYEETVRKALAFLGIELPDGVEIDEPELVKQADEVNEEWERKYHEIRQQEVAGASV